MKKKKRRTKKHLLKTLGILIVILLIVALIVGLINRYKPMPEGTSFQGPIHNLSESDIKFLNDLTYLNGSQKVFDQEIFDEVFTLVDNAEQFILIDMFLFNSGYPGKERLINITTTLKTKLINKKTFNPDIKINFITDPINTFYGSYTSDELESLKDAGVNVIITDLTKMRDSNPFFSGLWRSYFRWFGVEGTHWVTSPIGGEKKVSVRSITVLLNTKANHRKNIIADSGNQIKTIITSANPHEASSTHSNIGFKIDKLIWQDILMVEESVARFSGGTIQKPNFDFVREQESGNIQAQILTEGKIRSNLISDIDSTNSGDGIDIGMFYLSDRKIVRALKRASDRDVKIRLILDPNKDAFTREKNGVPNRQTGYELQTYSDNIEIRWYDTHGEQYHTKMVIIYTKNKVIIYGGSANLTKRNIGDLNLEMNIKIISPENNLTSEISDYYEKIWNNQGANYTLDFEVYEDSSKHWLYRFQEWSGLSSF